MRKLLKLKINEEVFHVTLGDNSKTVVVKDVKANKYKLYIITHINNVDEKDTWIAMHDWFSAEDMIRIVMDMGLGLTPTGKLIDSFYECPSCSYKWAVVDNVTIPEDCPKCFKKNIDPHEVVDHK